MQRKRFTLFMFALSVLLLALFIQPIFAVADQSDGRLAILNKDVGSNEARTEPSSLPEQELVAIIALNDIELQADGSDVQALVDEVPNDSVVTGIEFKLSISQEEGAVDAQAVEPHITKGSSSLNLSADSSYVVQERDHARENQTSSYAVARTTEPLHDLDGSEAQGEWTIKLVSNEASLVGRKANISLVIHYTARVHVPEIRSGSEAAGAAIHRLPVPAWEMRRGEWESGRRGDGETGRVGEGEPSSMMISGRRGDGETGRRGERESGRRGDGETGRVGEGESGRAGDGESGRRGEWETGRRGERESGRRAEGQSGQREHSEYVLPDGWQTIENERFEGRFPNGEWIMLDDSNDGNERYWDDDNYKPYNGNRSAWPANGGTDRLDPNRNNYPNNMDSWMIYGPFDLSDATDAETYFELWHEMEPTYDFLYFGVSSDGINFTGLYWHENSDWKHITVNYSDWVGRSAVWVAWYFHSDGSRVDNGPFVDDIDIRKFSGNQPNNTIHLPIIIKPRLPTPTATPRNTPRPTPTPRNTPRPTPRNTPRPTPTPRNTPRPTPSATPASEGEAPDSIYDIDGTFRASNGTNWLRFNPSAQGLDELLRGNIEGRGFPFLVDEVEYKKTGSNTATLEGTDRSLVYAGATCLLEGKMQFTSPDTFHYSGTVRVWIPIDSRLYCRLPKKFDDTFTRD